MWFGELLDLDVEQDRGCGITLDFVMGEDYKEMVNRSKYPSTLL